MFPQFFCSNFILSSRSTCDTFNPHSTSSFILNIVLPDVMPGYFTSCFFFKFPANIRYSLSSWFYSLFFHLYFPREISSKSNWIRPSSTTETTNKRANTKMYFQDEDEEENWDWIRYNTPRHFTSFYSYSPRKGAFLDELQQRETTVLLQHQTKPSSGKQVNEEKIHILLSE